MRVTERRRGRGCGLLEHDGRTCCFTKAKNEKTSFVLGLAESVVAEPAVKRRRREHDEDEGGEVEADEARCIAVHARSWCARRIILSA